MLPFPKGERNKDVVFNKMNEMRKKDANWKDGKTFSLVYYAGEEITNVAKEAYMMFFHENGLNPIAFQSLQQFEKEVIAMETSLFHGDEETVGSLTSGGTESILMAVKTYRDLARKTKPHIKNPEMIVPQSVHAAFHKAGHYFNVKVVEAPLTDEFKVDIEAVKKLMNENTILLVGSAPQYPHGIIDPIEELGKIAIEHELPLHVDACLGGFIIPFLQKIGRDIPPFDFRVEGVTSISADLHKYGYAAKGVSSILYKSPDLRHMQYFAYADWPGGIFVSPTATGTRPGGAIASAWAVLQYLGEEGYIDLAKRTIETTDRFLDGIRQIPELYILGDPKASIFAIGSHELNVFSIADRMEEFGWFMDRQQLPNSLHFMITPAHENVVEQFLTDLKRAVEDVKAAPEKYERGSAAMYGMMGQIPDRAQVTEYMKDTLNKMMRLRKEE